jgi:hypothetical protein
MVVIATGGWGPSPMGSRRALLKEMRGHMYTHTHTHTHTYTHTLPSSHFVFAVLVLELRAFTLSHPTSSIFVKDFFFSKIGTQELFGFKP